MLKKWRTIMLFALVSLCFVFLSETVFAQNQQAKNGAAKTSLASLNVSGPFKSGNLAVFLIHGKDAVPNQKVITLEEGLARKAVKVYETGTVNQLQVENIGDVAVFIQSGDIVKGGKQDRTLQYDLVLQPKSGRVPVDSFCVEQGRWNQRGHENRAQFSGSSNMLASKGLKLAAKKARSQGEVWKEVQSFQTKAQGKAFAQKAPSVVAQPSPSSLQLTLESDGVKKLSESFMRDLKPVTAGKTDTIGYAFAINGKINSVDVYSSHDLFERLWPKLMLATAQEAAAESEEGKRHAPPAVETVKKYIADNENAGTESKQDVGGRLVVVRRDSPKNFYMQTESKAAGSNNKMWFRKSLLAK